MSTEQPEVQQQVTTTPTTTPATTPTTTPTATTTPTRVARDSETGTATRTVTKQKDPKRVAMARQLGLRSKEYKLKKQQIMKSEKEVKFDAPTSDTSKNSSKTMMIGVVGLGALGLGYFAYNKFKSSLHLPTLTPAIIEKGNHSRKKQEKEKPFRLLLRL